MYTVFVRRKREKRNSGYYSKQFDNLEDVAEFIMSSHNYSKILIIRGLTRKKRRILAMKCNSVYKKLQRST